MNCARKPEWRIAAKERGADGAEEGASVMRSGNFLGRNVRGSVRESFLTAQTAARHKMGLEQVTCALRACPLCPLAGARHGTEMTNSEHAARG